MHKSPKRRGMRYALLAAVGGLALPFMTLAPAYAAPTCTNPGSLNNIATASCTGSGQAQLTVTCTSIINPFRVSSRWISMNGGGNIAFHHSTCIGTPPRVFVNTR